MERAGLGNIARANICNYKKYHYISDLWSFVPFYLYFYKKLCPPLVLLCHVVGLSKSSRSPLVWPFLILENPLSRVDTWISRRSIVSSMPFQHSDSSMRWRSPESEWYSLVSAIIPLRTMLWPWASVRTVELYMISIRSSRVLISRVRHTLVWRVAMLVCSDRYPSYSRKILRDYFEGFFI